MCSPVLHTQTHTLTHTHKNTHSHTHTKTHTHTHTLTHTHKNTHSHTHTHTHTQKHTLTHTHSHTHTKTHTHTHRAKKQRYQKLVMGLVCEMIFTVLAHPFPGVRTTIWVQVYVCVCHPPLLSYFLYFFLSLSLTPDVCIYVCMSFYVCQCMRLAVLAHQSHPDPGIEETILFRCGSTYICQGQDIYMSGSGHIYVLTEC
jgi:cation transport ATPase